MKSEISKFEAWMIALQLKEPFRFAHGTFYQLPRVLLRLEVNAGASTVVGWGEAAIDFPFVNYDMFDVYDALSRVAPHAIGLRLEDRHEILFSHRTNFLDVAPAARCALNMALDDALAKIQGVAASAVYPVRRLTGMSLCSVGFDQSGNPDAWSGVDGIVKLKVGQDLGHDFATIKLAEQLAKKTGKLYALDFNAAYTLEEVTGLIRELQSAGCWALQSCVLWEQPLKCQSPIAEWARLANLLLLQTPATALVADESFTSAAMGRRLVAVGVGLNYKIQKFGGILAAIELEDKLGQDQRHIKSFVGGTFPSPLGRAYDILAAKVIRSADLPGDGLLPASTYLSPESLEAFSVTPDLLGLGVQPNEGIFSRLIIEDPIEEFYRIRVGKMPERIQVEIGGSYAEAYVGLSGRSVLWNMQK